MILSEQDLTALFVTLKLASVSTLVLLIIGTPLAWWLSRSQWRFKYIIEAIIALPLILPPTVLGFYLLISLGPNGPIGGLVDMLGGAPLAFTFTGLVIGSVFYSMPFVVQPLQNAFTAVGQRPLEVAATLRASPLDRFFTIAVPMAKPGFITASVLGFAHTLGEFGVVLMIGGNIPGSTQVASIAIYDHVEALEYGQAHWLAASLLLFSFLLLIIVYGTNRRYTVAQP
ncbi:MAG: molybdate transport system permease protein [Porticoccaceae bacterium]|jgi:molybdate transport system permease protein|nr:molybdate ABC transporter permease subunit [Porticoccaceae bacterium]|tara:strand:- start:2267 stop:2950 length:684 start_codon:yes stop_codon:yes gene_type:complete